MKQAVKWTLIAIGAYILVTHGPGTFKTITGTGKAGSNVIASLQGR